MCFRLSLTLGYVTGTFKTVFCRCFRLDLYRRSGIGRSASRQLLFLIILLACFMQLSAKCLSLFAMSYIVGDLH